MTVLARLMDHTERLVHPDVRASVFDCARQRSFIASRLSLSFFAIVAIPLCFAMGHVPAFWEAVALAWLSVPLMAALFVSRTGRLSGAEIVSLAAWVGFALTACLGGGLSLCGTFGVLLLVPLEAGTSASPKAVLQGTVLALGGFVLASAAVGLGLVQPLEAGANVRSVAILGPVFVYGLGLALVSAALRAQQERRYALDEIRHRVLAEATGDLVLRYDRMGGVLSASREAERLFGIAPRELLGRGFFERVHVGDRPAFLKAFGDAAASGGNATAILRLRVSRTDLDQTRQEEPVFAWIEMRARRFDALDSTQGVVDQPIIAVVRDITSRMQHEQAIKAARDEAERANSWKDGFIANVSHELRTPLNAIIGFSEILSNPELSPSDAAKQREYAAIITSSGQHLLSVVNSLLDISKIDAGRFEIDPEPFNISDLIQACCAMVSLKAEQAGITLSQERLAQGLEIVGDKRACKQIVINLLSNALKFTPRGGAVSIGIRPHGNSVSISVADTGVGIASADLPRLGDAFFQSKTGYDRPFEGTGLGLSVVRGLVGLHGGTIGLDSAPGDGTRVTVRLPLDCRSVKPGAAAAKIDILPRLARSPMSVDSVIDKRKVQKIA